MKPKPTSPPQQQQNPQNKTKKKKLFTSDKGKRPILKNILDPYQTAHAGVG